MLLDEIGVRVGTVRTSPRNIQKRQLPQFVSEVCAPRASTYGKSNCRRAMQHAGNTGTTATLVRLLSLKPKVGCNNHEPFVSALFLCLCSELAEETAHSSYVCCQVVPYEESVMHRSKFYTGNDNLLALSRQK